jgi:hypothetical protein
LRRRLPELKIFQPHENLSLCHIFPFFHIYALYAAARSRLRRRDGRALVRVYIARKVEGTDNIALDRGNAFDRKHDWPDMVKRVIPGSVATPSRDERRNRDDRQ